MTDDLLKRLSDAAGAKCIILDRNGNIFTWNDESEQLMGYRSVEIIGQNISIFYLPLEREKQVHLILLKEAEIRGEAEQQSIRVRKDGNTFNGNIKLTAWYDNGGVCGYSEQMTRLPLNL